jgi:hypothetical protein
VWEPVGPLPAAVYWRRRWVALGSALAVIVVITWGIAAVTSTPDEPETIRRAALSAPQETSPPPAAPLTAALLPATLPPAAPPPGVSQPGAAGSVPLIPSTPESEPATSTPPQSTPPTTEAHPVPCTNDMIAVRAEVDGPEHPLGERMVLRLVVTNSSAQPCVRDLDPVRQEIVVWSADGSRRLWSSNDCSSAKGADLRTLAPGQPLAFTVRWAGRTSAPGCPARRDTLPAGEYRLLTRVDDVISPPTQFVRTP